jgi:hypothetical protein
MNQYLLLRRLRGPLILVTIGVMALLDQYGVLSFGRSWPLILIVIGILMLAERVVLAQMPPPPPGGFYPDGCMPMPPAAPTQPVAGQTGSPFAGQSQEERKY